MHNGGMSTTHTFTVKTDADSRSNRRCQTYNIEAATADDALTEAEMRVHRMIGGNRSVWAKVVAVNGEPYVNMAA